MPISRTHPLYDVHIRQWSRCRDAVSGLDAVKARRERYLPRLEAQSNDEYSGYLKRATYYGASKRTVQALTGTVFRKPTTMSGFRDQALLENIGAGGLSFDSLSQNVVREQLTSGRLGLLTDMPPEPNGNPFVSIYKAEDIINWRVKDNVLTRVVLREQWEKPDPNDEFGFTMEEQYRMLELADGTYRQRLWRKDNADFNEMNIADGVVYPLTPVRLGKTLDFIPFCFCNATNTTATPVEPPLLELVDMNLSHFMTSADLEHGAHYTALPTAWVAGFPTTSTLKIGSTTAWVSESSDARAGFLEYTGQGLRALQDLMVSKETKMAVLGARLLEEQKKQAEAAETHRLRTSGEAAALAVIVQAASEALSKTLFYVSFWLSRNENPEVMLNDDFVAIRMGPQELVGLMQARQAGEMSQQTFLWNLERGELLPPGTSIEDEIAKIEAQPPAVVTPVAQNKQDPRNIKQEIGVNVKDIT